MAKLVPDTGDPSVQDAPKLSPPSYKMVGDSKLAVAKGYGALWKSRRDAASKKRSDKKLDQAWEEALRYYNNDQSSNRNAVTGAERPVRGLASKIILEYAETENVIFANTNSAAAAIYAKNPAIAVTCANPQLEKMGQTSQKLINTLLAKIEAPGVSLKSKAQRAITSAFLCNLGWIKIGWTAKVDSSEQAISDLQKLSDELGQPEKTPKEIETIEGQLRALDDQFSMLSESGPYVKYLPPEAILRDPMSIEEDLSDAYWAMEADYLPTSYIRAKWFKKGEDGQDESVYAPTHYLSGNGNETSIEDQVNNFSIFDQSKSYTELGFETSEAYDQSKVTKVWWVWDKVTRRVFLYHDKAWSWPIWVWDDPLKLTTFFPWVAMYFYCSPQGGESKGEVSYYLDQQDGINLCNSLTHTVRTWAATKTGYDPASINNSDVNKYLFSNKLEAIPFTVPEGKSLKDILPQALVHPASQQLQLFDKNPLYQAISKISVVNEVMRGGEFRTNTTNQAVQTYNQVTQSRYDAIIDRVEDAIGRVGYMLLQLCWRYMDQETVAQLIGDEDAQEWTNLTDKQIRSMSIRVEGGSTQKPTSNNKKQEVLQLMQILGQFAAASPVAVVLAVKAASRAFSDSMDLDADDWEMLTQSMMQSVQNAMTQPQGEGAPSPDGGQGQPDPQQMEQLFQKLPPEAQKAVKNLVSHGMPPMEALKHVVEALGQNNGPAQPIQ